MLKPADTPWRAVKCLLHSDQHFLPHSPTSLIKDAQAQAQCSQTQRCRTERVRNPNPEPLPGVTMAAEAESCHCHPRMCPSTSGLVCRLTTALLQRQHHTARTEGSGCRQAAPPHSAPATQPDLPPPAPLPSPQAPREVGRLQGVGPCSSSRMQVAAVVPVEVSTPEQLQPVPSVSELEEGVVLSDLLQQPSLVQVGFCQGHPHGLQLPLQLWHLL